MGLTTAFSNAFSGLTASSRRAELVSNNISNATTDGFSRREIHLSSYVLNGQGGGVKVTDVTRIENAVMSSARREAEAEVSSSSVSAGFVSRIARALGDPGDAGALSVQYAELESSFTAAANDPSNDILLNNVTKRSAEVVETLNRLSVHTNDLRLEADTKIEQQVEVLNSKLSQLADLNIDIRDRQNSGSSTASLKDRQSNLLDELNAIIPVKIFERDFNQIAIFTPSGGTLLDGNPTQFSFSKVPVISHGMTASNGALSNLIVNGSPISINSDPGFFEGGSLGALFDARDTALPKFNSEIDGLAADLVSRFQSPLVDPTLAGGDPGLFTDSGGQYLSGNELGLAGRLTLNSSIDPKQGGQPWQLRAGLNATTPGDVGQNSNLRSYLGALQASLTPAIGISGAIPKSAPGFAAQLASAVSVDNVSRSDKLVYEQGKQDELREAELSLVGVDTDVQLQNLMEVEAAYAANARVMSVLDKLLSKLLEM